MTTDNSNPTQQETLNVKAARNLANTTKTVPQMVGVSPRWLLKLLPWTAVEAGTYRVNRLKIAVREDGRIQVDIVDGKAQVRPHHLRQLALFRDADDALLEAISKTFRSEKFEKGSSIVKEGEKGDKFYVLAKGKAEVHTHGKNGNKISIEVLGEGDFFGEIALFDNKERNATVTALTPVICVTLNRSQFSDLLKKNQNVHAKLEQIIRERKKAMDQLVNEFGERKVMVQSSNIDDETILQSSFVDYEEDPREYPLSTIQSIISLPTRVTDLYNSPINQLQEQIRLTVEGIKEQQEWEIINNNMFGLLNVASPSMSLQTRNGPPMPDDMDELISKVWKHPAYFLAHPRAIAAFGRECTRRGVPPPVTEMYGVPFLTWRGIPIVPCNKIPIDYTTQTTSILLMRVGEQLQGVVGLHQPGIPCEYQPSLSVRFMNIDSHGRASYLLTLYHSVAVMVDDALGVLENVEIGGYYDYGR